MKIAVVGGGIAGLAAAWLLKEAHEITLFESADYLGGHARTIPVDYGSTRVWAETGFKYLFPSTHPTVIALMRAVVALVHVDIVNAAVGAEVNIGWTRRLARWPS